jgi:endonuclease-3
MAASAERKRHAAKVVRALTRDYPDATCALDFETPLELLIATILSAQCTDERVNMVTEKLFQRYRTAADYARTRLSTLEKEIRSTGFFRNKAKAIKECCRRLVDDYDGQLPQDIDRMVELPGIGRKTANVVLGTAYGIPTGVVVDTHVGRLSRRLGMTEQKNPEKVEAELMDQLPTKEWIDFSHRMIHHGRRVCTARRPHCGDCSMSPFCPKMGVDE